MLRPATRRPRIAQATRPGTPLLSCISPVRLENINQHQCRNRDDEGTCNEFEYAHTYLLAALRYQGGSSTFKSKIAR